jgi:signal transduction histidine kinase
MIRNNQRKSAFRDTIPVHKQLRFNLIVFGVLMAVIPLVIVARIISGSTFTTYREYVGAQLDSIAQLKTAQIDLWLSNNRMMLNVLYTDLSEADESLATALTGDSRSLAQVQEDIGQFLVNSDAFNEVFAYDLEGNVLISSSATNVGKTVANQPYFASSLQDDYTQSPFYELGNPALTMLMMRPVIGADGQVLGAFAARFNLDTLNHIMADLTGLGEIGETYLVSRQNNYPLTPSRFENDAILLHAHHSEGIDRALTGEAGRGVYGNYEESPRSVIGSFRFLPELDAALMVEAVEADVLAPAWRDLTTLLVILGVAAAVAAAIAWFFANRITQPLRQLADMVRRYTQGDMDARTDIKSENEIGQLGASFNSLAEQLSNSLLTLEELVLDAQIAREAAERADQVKSAFLASMSHELRTPLNSVINFTKFVQRGVMGPTTDKQNETLEKVVQSAKHLLALINDVLDISKIESGSLALFKEDNVNLREILETAVSTTHGLIEDKPITIKTEIPQALPIIHADRQRMLQVLLNIVSNAAKFTQQGSITIGARVKPDALELYVKDTGPGIAPEDQALVFEPFKQTNTGLRQGGGTGLGMPISKSLVEAHDGTLQLDSTPGTGTTFTIRLPITASQFELLPVPA